MLDYLEVTDNWVMADNTIGDLCSNMSNNDISDLQSTVKITRVCSNCRKPLLTNTPDYYWRDYTGEVPEDAIPGGLDLSSKTTYIGQAYYPKVGLLIGTAYPGNVAVKLSSDGSVKVSDVGVKILCGSNKNCFVWETAESSNLHLTTIGKHLVVGGVEESKMINIGRAMYQNELIIGRVAGYEAENAKLYFVYGDKEIGVKSYQVLTINKKE